MARHLLITGRVQGVGYRAGFEERARALGLSGWVRNRHDGSVEAMVDGDARALDAIVEWAGCGPAGAQVRHVAVRDIEVDGSDGGRFTRLPTA